MKLREFLSQRTQKCSTLILQHSLPHLSVVTIPLAIEETLSTSLDDYEMGKMERKKFFFEFSKKRGNPQKRIVTVYEDFMRMFKKALQGVFSV